MRALISSSNRSSRATKWEMRRLTRMMLVNLGARSIYEAPDGVAALDAIRSVSPDVMIMNWDMPVLDGPEVMRIATLRP